MIEFLQSNWLWILALLFIGLHLFGGGCGMGRHSGSEDDADEKSAGAKGKSCH
jgi:hypothetical protein